MLKNDELTMSAVIRMCIDLGIKDKAGFDATRESEVQEMRINNLKKQLFELQILCEDITSLLFDMKKSNAFEGSKKIAELLEKAGFIEDVN